MKKQNGITLIALIITIIVLLILAGVSISMVIGDNGILTQANQAKQNAIYAEEQEQVELAVMAAKAKKLANPNLEQAIKAADIQEQLEVNGQKDKIKSVSDSTDGTAVVTVEFKTGNLYTVKDGRVTRVGNNADSGETGSYGELTTVINNLIANPSAYLLQAQALGQDTSIEEIAIGTDGEVVNLSYWDYYLTDDGLEMSLGDGDVSTRYGGYKGPTEGGAIKGKMPQYIYKDGDIYPITKLVCTFKSQIIENCDYDEGRKIIFDASKLTVVPEIPTTVTSIGAGAFYGCTGLTNITIPSGVTSIGAGAFYRCTGLTNITIPSGVTSIGSEAFAHCTGLTDITIPGSVTSIGEYAFRECTGLTNITIPDGVTSIGIGTFTGCTGLTNITIPSGVTSIGTSAFSGCTGLTNITIPSGVTSIGSYVFSSCTGLTNITIPSGVTSIGTSAFYGCTGLTNITIPSTVTSIGISAFYGCTGLTNITIPSGVTSIGTSAFYGCTGLTNITIPSGVTSIGSNTFYKCSSLTNITIPNSVTSIGSEAFAHCTGLTDITIPGSVTSIGKHAFAYCTGLTNITIPGSVTSIGEYAFRECTGLKNITIPSSVAKIGNYAFYKCAKMTDIYCEVVIKPSGWSSYWNNNCSANVHWKEGELKKLKEGDYVKFDTGNSSFGTNGIIMCRVLYSLDSEYGVQIISDQSVSKVRLETSDYNDAFNTLNNEAYKFYNPTYAYDARSVGTLPTISSSGYFTQKYTCGNYEYTVDTGDGCGGCGGSGIYGNDENYKTDYNQLKKIGILGCLEEYWMGSRFSTVGSGKYNYGLRYITTNPADITSATFFSSEDTYDFYEKGLRTCIYLRPDLKITGGTGADAQNAYTLGL